MFHVFQCSYRHVLDGLVRISSEGELGFHGVYATVFIDPFFLLRGRSFSMEWLIDGHH